MTQPGGGGAGIAAAVRSGARSAVDVAAESLARAAAYDAVQPQTWIERLTEDAVLERARNIDRRVRAGEALPLAGVPFALKDNFDLGGTPTTAGCPAFAYRPERDAAVVGRLIAAGAVPIGKTNMDQFATGLTGSRSPYGALGCVFNRAFVSGGSSSGSAVAVAAGVVPIALGSDTAGSGRVPAAFNGLFGLKPTRGRWSGRGLVPACRSLDCVSAFATTIADLRLIDEVLAGFDAEDAYSRAAPAAASLPAPASIGIPHGSQLDWRGDASSAALFEAAAGTARRTGARLVEIDIAPLIACAELLYEGPWVAERAAAMAGILRDRPNAVHPVVRAIAMGGARVTAAEAFEGFHRLKAFERTAQALWRTVDALLMPTTPTIYRIAEVLAEPFALNAHLGAYTNFVNLLDMAAVAVPAGFRTDATGFGASLIGPAWSEALLLDLADRMEAAAPTMRPPLDLASRPATVRLAVAGAHLSGLPLHWQLTAHDARFVRACRTEAAYRLYAIAASTPPKPALIHSATKGAPIEVEIYEMERAAFGAFVADVLAPLAIGTIVLEDGEAVKGFVGEARAAIGAEEITRFGGWRGYLASVSP